MAFSREAMLRKVKIKLLKDIEVFKKRGTIDKAEEVKRRLKKYHDKS